MMNVAEYVQRLTDRLHRPILCSACRLPRAANRRLISGPSIYICEECIGKAAARLMPVQHSAVCSFCAHPERPILGGWSDLSICDDCVHLAQSILADNDHPDAPSNER